MTQEPEDIERLMAYADGELDPAAALAVERRLATDAEARRLVAAFLQQPALLRAAFAGPARSAGIAPAANSNRPGWRTAARAAAAVVLLLGGLAAGWFGAELRLRSETESRMASMEAAIEAQRTALNVALERNSNGEPGRWISADGQAQGTITPLMTFVNEEGSFCREVEQDFTIDSRRRTAYGLACRVGEGRWEVRYWLFESPQALPGLDL